MQSVAQSSETGAGPARRRTLRTTRTERDFWAQLVAGFIGLTAIAASLALAVGQYAMGWDRFRDFLNDNRLSTEHRTQLITWLFISIGTVDLLAAIYLIIRRAKGVPRLFALSAFFSPLIVAFALPALCAYRLWFNNPLPHLTLLLVVVLALEQLFRASFAAAPEWLRRSSRKVAQVIPIRLRRLLPMSIVLLAASAYTAFAAYYTILEHWRFATGGYDLGIYDNLVANLLDGRPFRAPVCTPEMSYLSNHAEFGIFFVAPVYALFPRSETLLVLQAIFLGFAAVPLYLFGATQISRAKAMFLALAYLLYAPMHGANFYDFHWMPMSVPLWLTLFYGLARRKLWVIVVAVFFVLPMREETGVLLTCLGLFLMLSNYWPRVGFVFCLIGMTWFIVIKFVIMPLAGKWWFENIYKDLIAPGEKGYGSVVKTILINPAYVWTTLAKEPKLVYALHMFAPLALLPFRKPLLALLAIPGFFFTLLTTGYDPTLSLRFQYTTHWIPWLFASAVLSIMLLRQQRGGLRKQWAAVLALVFGVVCHSTVYGAVIQHEFFVGGFEKVSFEITDEEMARYRTFREIIAQIPMDASVAASESVVAHVANRPNAYSLKIAHGDAEFILINAKNRGGDNSSVVRDAFQRHEYGLLDARDGFYLFKQFHRSPDTDDALRKLNLPRN